MRLTTQQYEVLMARQQPPTRKAVPATEKHDLGLERDLHKLISQELNRRGIAFVHSRCDKRTTQEKGVSDYIMCIKGKFCAMEVKVGANKPTKEQWDFLEIVKKNEGEIRVAYSFEAAKHFIESLLPPPF